MHSIEPTVLISALALFLSIIALWTAIEVSRKTLERADALVNEHAIKTNLLVNKLESVVVKLRREVSQSKNDIRDVDIKLHKIQNACKQDLAILKEQQVKMQNGELQLRPARN